MSNGSTPTVVLIVDAYSAVRMLLGEYLSTLGYAVLEAADAEMALVMFDSHPTVRAVISDTTLPGKMTGLLLAEAIAQRRPGTAVALTSADLQRPPGKNLGEAYFLPKPYDPAQIADWLARLSAGQRSLAG